MVAPLTVIGSLGSGTSFGRNNDDSGFIHVCIGDAREADRDSANFVHSLIH